MTPAEAFDAVDLEHPTIAWEGPVQMVEAKWTDKDGSLVRLKLLAVNEDRRNPFVTFTKRKKGSGTRFTASIVELEPPHTPVYSDEAMLAGWNDSQSGGMSVTLWLAHDRMGHPFEGVSRKTALQLVLIELDDDNEPVNQRVRERMEAGGKSPYRTASERPSYAAAMLCKNPEFWEWIDIVDPLVHIVSEDHAALWLRERLNVGSRGALDRDAALAERFRKEIQHPFSTWLSRPMRETSGPYAAASPETRPA